MTDDDYCGCCELCEDDGYRDGFRRASVAERQKIAARCRALAAIAMSDAEESACEGANISSDRESGAGEALMKLAKELEV